MTKLILVFFLHCNLVWPCAMAHICVNDYMARHILHTHTLPFLNSYKHTRENIFFLRIEIHLDHKVLINLTDIRKC